MPTPKKPAAKKAAAKQTSPKKAAPKKSTGAKSVTKKKTAAKPKVASAKKTAVKKTPAGKAAPAKKAVASKKAAARKPAATRASMEVSPPPQPRPVRELSSEREQLIQEIKKRLVEEKARLVADAEATRNDLPDDETYPDLGDQATAETDRSFMLRLRSRESKLIKKIDDTIELIDKGDYGVCEECGEDIDSRRLEARPVTTYCIECKTRQEEDERLR